MTAERAFAGGIPLAIAGAGAPTAYTNGNTTLGHIFVLVGVLGVVVTFANRLPVLHKLPLVGAIPPPNIRFHLEAPRGESEMEFPMDPAAEARVVLCAGVLPEGRRQEITRVTLNAYVVGAIDSTGPSKTATRTRTVAPGWMGRMVRTGRTGR